MNTARIVVLVIAGEERCARIHGHQAETVAALRHGNASALALVLDTPSWASRSSAPDDGRTTRSAALLSAAGWRVSVCGPQTDLAEAWQGLARRGVVAGRAR